MSFENMLCKNEVEMQGKFAKFDSENLSHAKYTLKFSQQICTDHRNDPGPSQSVEIGQSPKNPMSGTCKLLNILLILLLH